MLILSRKKDERIVIDDNIQIQIVDVRSDIVKIGIEAPKSVKIYREEVWSNIQKENREADVSIAKGDVETSISSIIQQKVSKTSLSNSSSSDKDSSST